jgi:hypothetical protein
MKDLAMKKEDEGSKPRSPSAEKLSFYEKISFYF